MISVSIEVYLDVPASTNCKALAFPSPMSNTRPPPQRAGAFLVWLGALMKAGRAAPFYTLALQSQLGPH